MPDPAPVRGEIWWMELPPGIGSEADRTRPAIVVSTTGFDHLPLRLVIPLTTWQERFARQRNKVFIPRSDMNGLDLDSAADVLHIRGLALQRFRARAGVLELDALAEVMTALVVALDLPALPRTPPRPAR